MRVRYLKRYRKAVEKLPPKVRQAATEALTRFFQDPFAPELHNHALKGSFEWLRSINVTGDYRALYRELSGGTYEFVEFVDIWTHSRLYGK